MIKAVAEKHAVLIRRLYAKTQEKALDWQLSGSRDPMVSLKSSTVVLRSENNFGNQIEYLVIQTDFGEHIETVSDEDLLEVDVPSSSKFDSYLDWMAALRHDAFRQAVGADQALDDLLGELDDDL